jgi:uncharacterized protein (DUF1800 family)
MARQLRRVWVWFSLSFAIPLLNAQPLAPEITGFSFTNGQTRIQFAPFAAAEQFKVLQSGTVEGPYVELLSGSFSGFDWTGPLPTQTGFFRLEAVPLSSNALGVATLLNRLAYGPTPDELERVTALGPDAYIQEQLTPESIQENLDFDRVVPDGEWQYVTATGTGSSSTLYMYLTSIGEGWIDDVKLVAGTVPEAGVNLIRNGGFEVALTVSDWTISDNHLGSAVVSDVKHSGNFSLYMTAASPGTTRDSAIWQSIRPSLSSSQTYTLSYWFLRSRTKPSGATLRLSGSGIVASSDTLMTRLAMASASLDDLRAWHVLHAVRSKKQLLEVLLQFLENHFVTQWSKSREYIDIYYPNADARVTRLPTQFEFKEIQRWRNALLNPQCTFHDLLKISAESPPMIIYLDTVNSRGDGRNIANENYARELLELFTFGVDNGYDQNDIVQTSKAWTGWSVALVATNNEFNPFAPRLIDINPGINITNLNGVWAFKYRETRHNTSSKSIFPGKTIPARFGAHYTSKRYGANAVPGRYDLTLPARSGTNGIKDGYEVIAYLADLPFTQEYISVKLCRLFVHDDFAHGYDFTDAETTPEEKLVWDCMMAWDGSAPKGQIRKVLQVIFNSELFRGHGASQQKIKTPFEFTVSTIRALRSENADGTATADTDGFGIYSGMNRMGRMRLFDREEPDGYPESGPGWISAGTIAERLRFVQSVLTAPNQSTTAGRDAKNDAGAANVVYPVALLQKKLTSTQLRDAGAVVDYFLSILFPGEGKANLDLYRREALNYLNTADDGRTSSPFANFTPGSITYDTRVRGMVAMLLTSQRFQEQ